MDTQKVRNTQSFRIGEKNYISVGVEGEADSLQHPVRVVLRCGQVRLKHQPHTHGVTSVRRRVDWCSKRVLYERDTLVSKRSSIFSFVFPAKPSIFSLSSIYKLARYGDLYVPFLHISLCNRVGRTADVTLAHQRIGLYLLRSIELAHGTVGTCAWPTPYSTGTITDTHCTVHVYHWVYQHCISSEAP